MLLAGIDIGGTKISVCLGNEKGEILSSKRIQTQPLGGAKKGLPAIATLLTELLSEEDLDLSELSAIGISSPGPINSGMGKILVPPNLPGWENTELVRFFKEAFHKPIQMNHDAKAGALAEYHFGASKGTANLVYLTTSTGMGGGAIVDHKLVQGAADLATEVGHYILEINGPECPCGQRGCFEAYCGGAALAKKMRKEIEDRKIDTYILKSVPDGKIDKVDIIHLIEALKKEDQYALEVWEEFILRMAQGIGIVLQCFNPEVIILGTIAVHSGELLLEPLKKELKRFAWKESIDACRIEATTLGKSISELSALALAMEAAE